MELFILCILLLVYNVVMEFSYKRERKQLIDRIQAKDLVEYKKYEDKPEPKPEKTEKEYIEYL